MTSKRARRAVSGVASLLGFAAASLPVYVAVSWLRYGRAAPAAPEEADASLDRFMPEYQIVERHHVNVAAPADAHSARPMNMDLEDSYVIRAIFKGRELLLGADAGQETSVRGLVAVTKDWDGACLPKSPAMRL